jgi:hypothetical protein
LELPAVVKVPQPISLVLKMVMGASLAAWPIVDSVYRIWRGWKKFRREVGQSAFAGDVVLPSV